MPCPTCDHTMQGIGISALHNVRLCPRCGTVTCDGWVATAQVPMLVERVRKFLDTVDPKAVDHARHLGVIEACMRPAERT